MWGIPHVQHTVQGPPSLALDQRGALRSLHKGLHHDHVRTRNASLKQACETTRTYFAARLQHSRNQGVLRRATQSAEAASVTAWRRVIVADYFDTSTSVMCGLRPTVRFGSATVKMDRLRPPSPSGSCPSRTFDGESQPCGSMIEPGRPV